MMNFLDSSWLLINSHNMIYINTDVIIVFLKSINMIYFVNQLTIVKISLNMTFHAEFFNNDNFTIKFIIINIHEALDVSSYVTSSYCLLWLILFCWQKLHFAMYCWTFLQQFQRLHFHQTRFLILLTSKCSLTLVLWHSLMISSLFCETLLRWWVVMRLLVRIFLLFFLRIFLWVIFTLS